MIFPSLLRPSARAGAALAALAVAPFAMTACGSSSSAKAPVAPAPKVSDFPKPGGRTLEQLLASEPRGPQAALATSVFTPGENRLGFGMIDDNQKFVYGEAAVYLAPSLKAPVQGPFLAPLDSIVPQAPFRSQTTANDTAAIKAVYYTRARFPQPGSWGAVVMLRRGGKLTASPVGLPVAKSSAIPNVGDRPPHISTPTVQSVGGDVKSIDTRVPPDDMHAVDFKDVVGKRPVALLFATPQLCQSRVCGPVVDIEAQMEAKYGKQMTFIHQEVYKDNVVEHGLRPQLTAFHLHTEPWLFVIGRNGRIAARLEGSFGVKEFDAAVRAGLGA
jgi:hypothetical protein